MRGRLRQRLHERCSTSTRFHELKRRQNRCGLEVFTRNRFPQKIQVVMVEASAAPRAKFTIFLIEQCKFRAKIVTVLKSMRFRCLHDR